MPCSTSGDDEPRREAAVGRLWPFQLRNKPVVANFDVTRHEEQVRRLHIKVLKIELGRDDISRFGGVGKVRKQFVARNARKPANTAFAVTVLQLPVGQLHHHHKIAADVLDAFECQQERVSNSFDLLERVEFLAESLVSASVFGFRGHEFDGFEQPAGGASHFQTSLNPPRPRGARSL